MTFDELKVQVQNAGIVGAGGAGFPSYAKLDSRADTILLNCAECEPLLRLHRDLLERKTYEILSTLDYLRKTLGADRVIVATKAAYRETVAALHAMLPSFEHIELCTLKEVYPAGDEVVLIYETTGRRVNPGALPISVGVTVFNTETVYNMYCAMNGSPVTEKLVTVTGAVAKPQTFAVPLGMTVGALVDLAGGAAVKNPAYIMGGPMMGGLGTRYTVVTKTTNAVIVLPETHPLVLKKTTPVKLDLKRAMSACCQCSYCTDMCPRHLIGMPVTPHSFMNALSNHDSHNTKPYLDAMFCSGCGVCELYACGQGLSPRTLIAAFKNEMKKGGVAVPKDVPLAPVQPGREGRLVPIPRLTARLGLKEYDRDAPYADIALHPTSVKLLLRQHIGVPAVPCVKKGDRVLAGDVLAKAAEKGLSVPVHASIDGTVTELTPEFIVLHV